MNGGTVAPWIADWAWGLALIVFTVVLHAYGLGLLNRGVTARLGGREGLRHHWSASSFLIGTTALLVTVLHAAEAYVWATAFRLLGALADMKSAMLFSLNAMTSYGHEDLHLVPRWQMLGAVEALNGLILFGLTTAFLFTVLNRAWQRSSQKALESGPTLPIATRSGDGERSIPPTQK